MGGLASIPLFLIALLPIGLGVRGVKRKEWGRVLWCLLALAILGWLIWRMMSGRQE